jgi:hypothetical protein
MRKSTGAFQFSKYGFFVRKEVADKAIAMPFVHCQGCIGARTENAWSEDLSKRGDIGFVG